MKKANLFKRGLSLLMAVVTAVTMSPLTAWAATLPKTSKLTATAVSATEISLAWAAVSGAEKYNVYILKPNTTKYANLGSVTKTSVKVPKLAAGTTYKFKVAAVDVVNGKSTVGTASAEASVKTKSAGTAATSGTSDLQKYILQQVKTSGDNMIDVTKFISSDLSYSKAYWKLHDEAKKVLTDNGYDVSKNFYVDISYDSNNKVKFAYVVYAYSFPPPLTKSQQAKLDAEVAKALKYAEKGKSDIEKAVLLHDYICMTADYDYDSFNGAIGGTGYSHSPYGALILHKAVCDGYSTAYQLLLSKVGIESKIFYNEAMVHAWNLVKIDGKWYHVDVTFDASSQIRYRFFLKSDKDIADVDHYGWDKSSLPVVSETSYEDRYFENIPLTTVNFDYNGVSQNIGTHSPTPAVTKLGDLYFESAVDWTNKLGEPNTLTANSKHRLKLFKGDPTGGNAVLLGTFDTTSYFFKDGKKTDLISNLGSSYAIQYKNKIYFNTATEIYSVNTDGTSLTKVAAYKDNDGYIYYMRLKDGKLEYILIRQETKGEKTSEGYGRSSMDKYIGLKTVSIG